MVDPAKQCDDDQSDDTDRYDKQHDPALLAVGTRGQRDDADQAEHERAYEGSQHILRRAVFHDETGCPRSHIAGCGRKRRDHGAERKGCDRQHARRDDPKDAINRIRSDPG
ncbi:hypothetical protein D3C80_1239020 [compost metagenome]